MSDERINSAQHPSIFAARETSLETVESIRARLGALELKQPSVKSIVLSGSLARLDASELSDVDLVVVLQDEALADTAVSETAMHAVWSCLAPLGLEPPQGDGIFATPTSRQELCDGPCGVVAEDVSIFGKRIHLLLESRSVFGDDVCRELQRDILRRYAQHPFAERKGEFWKYLTDDLIRYWRSYSVWRNWDIKASAGGWYMRNVKLRHSRLLTYASLLLTCVVDEFENPSVNSLLDKIAWTPLERLCEVDRQYNANVFDEIRGRYNDFLEAINDANFRQRLEAASLSNPQDAMKEAPQGFVEMLDNSDKMQAALVKLIQVMPHAASDRVLTKLLF